MPQHASCSRLAPSSPWIASSCSAAASTWCQRGALPSRARVRVRVRSCERIKSSEGKVALGRLQVLMMVITALALCLRRVRPCPKDALLGVLLGVRPRGRLVMDAASRRRGAKSCIFAGVAEDQRHPPPAPPHLKPTTKISARNLKSDEWSAVAIRPEHGQGASAADTGFVEDVVPRALPVCLEQLSTPTASSVPAEPAAPSRLPARSQARLLLC